MTTTLERPPRQSRDMSAADVETCGEVTSRWWHGRTATKALLMSGIAAVALYGVGDLLSSLLYDGYSFKDQAISELSAFDSPVRPLMAAVILIHGFLVVALGVGVWRVADRSILGWVGGFLIAAGLVGLPTHTVFAMTTRGMETGFNDTMHIILSGLFSLFVFVAIALTAVAYRGWMRLYSITTLFVLMGFGAAASIAIRGIDENSTPWAGSFERINAYAYFAWLIVLAVILLRTRSEHRAIRLHDTPERLTDAA